ncbi:AzlD domain-containing protein [Zobellella denitrificans]
MDNTVLWLLFVAIGIGTFAIRLSFIQLHGRRGFNMGRYQKILQLLAPAVLAALSIPAIMFQRNESLGEPSVEQIVAAAVTALLSWYFKGVFWPLLMGMATFWGMRFYQLP